MMAVQSARWMLEVGDAVLTVAQVVVGRKTFCVKRRVRLLIAAFLSSVAAT